MRQAILVEPKHIVFKEVAAPKAEDLQSHQVLVHIKRIGICGSEIHSYHGLHPATFYPVVQGHEYSGVVVAVGNEVTVCKPGDNITARPQLVCGKCNPCKRGQYNVCEHLRVQAFQADGCAQDYFVVDDDRVAKLPEGMSLDFGAMIEPSAVGAHASNRTNVKGKNVVVSGAGTIGNLIAQFCIARGAKNVLITDVSDLRLAKARECGIKHTLNITKKTLKEAAQELFGEEGVSGRFRGSWCGSLHPLPDGDHREGKRYRGGSRLRQGSSPQHVLSRRARVATDWLDDVSPRGLPHRHRLCEQGHRQSEAARQQPLRLRGV